MFYLKTFAIVYFECLITRWSENDRVRKHVEGCGSDFRRKTL